ncbi:MAG TPA: hypothetical protein PK052_08445 [Anaerohalosphaeraceae bacterium]|nr:hypothetical protein [Anaerohalosphaeraceae bacterium]HOL31998.1 hypothetical protein [Anaerohalosphaeraceae bacterium]
MINQWAAESIPIKPIVERAVIAPVYQLKDAPKSLLCKKRDKIAQIWGFAPFPLFPEIPFSAIL